MLEEITKLEHNKNLEKWKIMKISERINNQKMILKKMFQMNHKNFKIKLIK